jgi:lipopolysaccharide transport system ATP-binding protein
MTTTEPFEGLPEGLALDDAVPGADADGAPVDAEAEPLEEEAERGPSAISVQGVSKHFRLFHERPTFLKERITGGGGKAKVDEFWALKDVSLEIEAGSMYGLIGHNGSGKSTLLRMMAGIHRPNGGTVTSTGRISALLELGAGFHPELTGRENIYLNASILGLSRKEIRDSIDDIVAFAAIDKFIDSPVKVYSSGMYVRLGFSVAVHVNPEILLIDEVIAVGDEWFQRRCFDHLYKLRKQGVTIVMVTHSLGLVQTMCDRAAWLDHGEVKAEGPAGRVVRQYLDQVNSDEEARYEDEAGAELDLDQPTRRGSGEIVVDRLEFLTDEGDAKPVGKTGDPLTVRLHYRCESPVEHPVFAVTLNRSAGPIVGTSNSRLAEVDLGVLEGTGHVDLVLDPLTLVPGSYQVTTGIYDEHVLHPYDIQEQAWVLHVQPGTSRSREGMVDLRGRWAGTVGR